MNKKLKKIIPFGLAILLLNTSIFTYATYFRSFSKETNLQIAAPKIHLISNTIHIQELDTTTKENTFQVVNFDDAGITSVDLSYKITIHNSQPNAPILWKLYYLQTDENNHPVETEVNPSQIFTLPAGISQTDSFKLIVQYDASGKPFESLTELSVDLDVIQKGSD